MNKQATATVTPITGSTETTDHKPEAKTKQRNPLILAASLATKLGKERAALVKAEAAVAKCKAEIAALESSVEPAVLAKAKEMLAG
jgi:hypothetical protein